MSELIFGAVAIGVAVLAYFAGRRTGKAKSEKTALERQAKTREKQDAVPRSSSSDVHDRMRSGRI